MTPTLDKMLENKMPHSAFAAAMREGIERFEHYRAALVPIPLSYTRTLLRRTDDFELVAMLWAAGSASPIHDHGDSRCWVVVLEGDLEVENYDRLDDGTTEMARLEKSMRNTIASGVLDHRANWRELHRVCNLSDASVYSLQLYAAPQTDFTIVDERTSICSRALPKYDSTFTL